MLSIPENDLAIYKYVYHSLCILMRLFKACIVLNFGWIEDHDVGIITLF